MGWAAAKERAGQDVPESLGPAASQTLDPRAGTPNAQGLAHRTRAALAQCLRGANPRWWLCYPAPDFRAENYKLQACATGLLANDANSAARAS